MLPCREVVQRLASDDGRRRRWRERVSLAMHVAMCRYCRAYARTLGWMGTASRRLYARPAVDQARTEAIIAAVRQSARQSGQA